MASLTYAQRAMMDAHCLFQTCVFKEIDSKKELHIVGEMILYRRDDEANIGDTYIVGRRLQLAACLVAANRLSIQQLEYLVRNITGSLPSPLNLADDSTGL